MGDLGLFYGYAYIYRHYRDKMAVWGVYALTGAYMRDL